MPTLKVLTKVIKERGIHGMQMIPSIHDVFFNGMELSVAIELAMENKHHHEFHGLDFGIKK